MYLGNIKIEPRRVSDKIQITYNNEKFILTTDIDIKEINKLINKNFDIVKTKINNQKIDENDINLITVKIVLYYLSTYILWKKTYPKEKNRDLIFLEKDIKNPQTNDIIINYLIKTYPNQYEEKCSILLNKSINETILYIKNRLDFQNM